LRWEEIILEPERESAIVEVLDRLLNKGVVLNADLIISVAGIPMIGVNLKAAIASIETMLDFGMMEAWDKDIREWYSGVERPVPLEHGEAVLFQAFGYLMDSQGIVSAWVPGKWYITDRRLLLWRNDSEEIIFEAPLRMIEAVRKVEGEVCSIERTNLELSYNGKTALIYISEYEEFKSALEEAAGSLACAKMLI
jgi:hypothetical protein